MRALSVYCLWFPLNNTAKPNFCQSRKGKGEGDNGRALSPSARPDKFFAPPETKLEIGSDWKDLEELNYLEGKTLDFVEEHVFQAAAAAHADGGVPVIVMDCGELNEGKVGELFYFLELSCGVSAYLLGVDPFEQPAVDRYQQNLFRLLGKPGCN